MQNIIYKNLHNCRKHNLKRLFGSENISYKTQTEFQISFRETFILLVGLIVSISSPHSSLSSQHSTSISWWFCVSDADLVWVLFPMVSSMAAWLCPDMLSGGTLCDIWYWLCLESWLWHDTGLTGGQNVTIITRQVSSSLSASLTDLFNFRIFPINSHISDLDSQQIKILLQSGSYLSRIFEESEFVSETVRAVSSQSNEFSSNQLLAVSKHINPSKV